MFENVGNKIKILAKTITIIGIIGSIIGGISLMASELILEGLLVIVGGSLFSWVGSFVLYGFGHLIETAEEIASNTRTTCKTLPSFAQQDNADTTSPAESTPQQTETDVSTKTARAAYKSESEQLYNFALQMYAKGNYSLAYYFFKRIADYKDAQKYIEELATKI